MSTYVNSHLDRGDVTASTGTVGTVHRLTVRTQLGMDAEEVSFFGPAAKLAVILGAFAKSPEIVRAMEPEARSELAFVLGTIADDEREHEHEHRPIGPLYGTVSGSRQALCSCGIWIVALTSSAYAEWGPVDA